MILQSYRLPITSKLTSEELVTKILLNYTEKVESFFEGDLDELSVDVISNKVFNTLYDRSPSLLELSTWESAVKNGLSKYDLPLAILRSTSGRDTYRVGLLAAAVHGLKHSGEQMLLSTVTSLRACFLMILLPLSINSPICSLDPDKYKIGRKLIRSSTNTKMKS